MEKGQLVSVESLRSVLLEDDDDSLPPDEIVYAFAYGSGVLSQQQTTADAALSSSSQSFNEKKMIDFIVVVRDSYRFHQANLMKNPDHYAGPFWGARDEAARVLWWQRHAMENRFFRNPGLYFNLTKTFKYGVVQMEDLLRDLQDWKYLYLAGRMQKPIVTLLGRQSGDSGKASSSSTIQYSQDLCNLPAALSASLLLLSLQNKSLPKNNNNRAHHSLDDSVLFLQIAALSFTGDPRMTAGAEDPAKVSKLVQSPGQLQRFRSLYADAIGDLEGCGVLSVNTPSNTNYKKNETIRKQEITWDMGNPKAHAVLWNKIPPRLIPQQRLLLHPPHSPWDAAQALQTMLPTIVAPAARYQSLKGLATAGFQKSWSYGMRKLSKGILKR